MESSWMIEQQGKSEGGKEPPSRSINQIFELFQSSKICLSGAKRLFRHAEGIRTPQISNAKLIYRSHLNVTAYKFGLHLFRQDGKDRAAEGISSSQTRKNFYS